MKSKASTNIRQPIAAPIADVPELPMWKAFVVQFSRDAGMPTGVLTGRIEHMSSGRRARFASQQELLATLTKMLEELGEETI